MADCSIAGCGSPSRRRGWCDKHYMRWNRTGDPEGTSRPSPGTEIKQRLAFYSASVPSGCTEWSGHTDIHGYGAIQIGGKMARAHRVAYEEMVGKIPAGAEIDHICHNRKCINVKHLRPVTKSANQLNRADPAAGVSVRNGKYSARIKVSGKEKWLGTFQTFDEAALAVANARRIALEAALEGK